MIRLVLKGVQKQLELDFWRKHMWINMWAAKFIFFMDKSLYS